MVGRSSPLLLRLQHRVLGKPRRQHRKHAIGEDRRVRLAGALDPLGHVGGATADVARGIDVHVSHVGPDAEMEAQRFVGAGVVLSDARLDAVTGAKGVACAVEGEEVTVAEKLDHQAARLRGDLAGDRFLRLVDPGPAGVTDVGGRRRRADSVREHDDFEPRSHCRREDIIAGL